MKLVNRILANLREIMMTQIKWTSMIYRAVALSGVFFLSASLGCGTNVNDNTIALYPLDLVDVSSGGAPGNSSVQGIQSFISDDGNFVERCKHCAHDRVTSKKNIES